MTGAGSVQKHLKVLGIILIITSIFPNYAFAYLDPGTGSMVIQAIIATIAAITCTYKVWYSKFIAFFHKNKDNDSDGN